MGVNANRRTLEVTRVGHDNGTGLFKLVKGSGHGGWKNKRSRWDGRNLTNHKYLSHLIIIIM